MMKLLIAGFTKLAYMPYINLYLESLQDSDVEIHVISWKRDEDPDIELADKRITIHEFKKKQQDEVAKIAKIGSFIEYRRFAKQVIKENTFDRVIVLHTLPAVLLADVLLHRYKNRFILDYRDYTYEGFAPFKQIVGSLAQASFATFVSSDAFRDALPKLDKIYTSHNLLTDSLNHRDIRSSAERMHKPIRFSFWGFIRHEEINRQIIKQLGNDNRFELHYYGREQQTALNLKSFVKQNVIQNVFFHGAYTPEERYSFAAQTDLIHNIYENDAGMQRAMGNKYYDGISFRIPQVCTPGSFMGKCVEKERTGIALDPSEDAFSDRLFQYYREVDWLEFNRSCDLRAQQILEEYDKVKSVIRRLVS